MSDDIGWHWTMSSDIVRCRAAPYMQIICKYPNNMAADVADVVASAMFLYVFESEEENDEKNVVSVYGVDHSASGFTTGIIGEKYVTKFMHD